MIVIYLYLLQIYRGILYIDTAEKSGSGEVETAARGRLYNLNCAWLKGGIQMFSDIGCVGHVFFQV